MRKFGALKTILIPIALSGSIVLSITTPASSMAKLSRADDVVVAASTRAQWASDAVTLGLEKLKLDGDTLFADTSSGESVVLRRSGPPKPEITALLQAIQAQHGVPVREERSAFSAAEYDKIVRNNADLMFNLPEPVWGFHVLGDGSGVVYQATAEPDAVTKERLNAVFTGAAPEARVVFAVEPRRSIEPVDGRLDDGNPFNGGALIRAPSDTNPSLYYLCGMGLRGQSRTTGSYVMTFARHCTIGAGEDWRTYSGLSAVGTNASGNAAADSTWLSPAPDKSFAQSIYTGSWYALTTRPILTGFTPGTGTTVYPSGAISGQATATVQTFGHYCEPYPGATVAGPMYRATFNNGGQNVGEGDSGSPIYNVNSNDNGVGRGLIQCSSLGGSEADCSQGSPTLNVNRRCGPDVYFVGITDVENALDLDIQ